MSDSIETVEQPTKDDAILQAIAELSKKIDNVQNELVSFKKETNVQLEAIRTGIVANSVDFDRLTAKVSLLSADVKELAEDVRHRSLV